MSLTIKLTDLPRLPEPNPDLVRLLSAVYDFLQIDVVHPIKDLATGENSDGDQREAYARDRKGVRIEPIGVRYPSEEHRRLHRIALNLTTRTLRNRPGITSRFHTGSGTAR
jgi:hypothetical protein